MSSTDPHPFAPADPLTGEAPVVVWDVARGVFLLPFADEPALAPVAETYELPLPVRWGPPSPLARLRRALQPVFAS